MSAPDLRVSSQEIAKALAGQADGVQNLEEHFAHLAWSNICEPGDGFAGMLVGALGAARALAIELEEPTAMQLSSLLAKAGLDHEDQKVFGKLESNLLDARERWRSRKSLALVLDSLKRIRALQGQVLTPQSENWPQQLNDLRRHAPHALWVRGVPEVVEGSARSVAIVGSRDASSYGEFVTSEFIAPLVSKNFTVVSGGAFGIDGMAHRGTVALGGKTIAVMAGGLDRLYPSGHIPLLESIVRSGAVISELPPGMAPTKWRFLQRNRIIAALSQATVVVEANWRSGAMNTVKHAEELGRPIGAVPGPVTSPKSAGCHKLIRDQRATLIADSADLLELLDEIGGVRPQDLELAGLGALETRALDAIGFSTIGLEAICSDSGLTKEEARIALGSLELESLIARSSDGWRRSQTTV
jgi:DNA processing protein